MDSRIANRLRFILERWIQGGALNQLLLTAGIIGLIAVLGGTLAFALSGVFVGYGDAIWWSFLRLSDPGYLGEDEGAVLRTIATVITVLGYVLFLGSLIAIMTQWLNSTIRRLESGLSPITVSGHTIILGWTNRTPSLLRELVAGETSLSPRQRRNHRIVVLASEVTPELRRELRDILGPAYDRWRIILRSGSQLRVEHLRRVDFEHASTIVLPGSDFSLGGYEASDARVVKTLVTMAHHLENHDRPKIVAEVLDPSRLVAVQRAYEGPIEAVSTNVLVSRIIAQNVRTPGLSTIYAELFSHAVGNEIYADRFPNLAGLTLAQASERFPDGIMLGVVRRENGRDVAHICPDADFRLDEEDFVVGIARSRRGFSPVDQATDEEPVDPLPFPEPARTGRRKILVLGWNHRFEQLSVELGSYGEETVEIDVLAPIPVHERKNVDAVRGSAEVRHHVGDFTEDRVLNGFDLTAFSTILLLGNNWMSSGDESDAQTLISALLLDSLLAAGAARPHIVVELMQSETASLIADAAETIVSPVLVSNVLAHVALRPEVHAALVSLFAPDGPEIRFVSASDLGLTGQSVRFGTLQRQTLVGGMVCLGVRSSGKPFLNPSKDRVWQFSNAEELIMLGASRY